MQIETQGNFLHTLYRKLPDQIKNSIPLEHTKDPHALEARFSDSRKEIKSAYQLRYKIFTSEYGAKIRNLRRLDKDHFDKYCHHLLVIDTNRGMTVGYTRVLTWHASRAIGNFYSETEFDLNPIRYLLPDAAEIGRTCIHPDYRNGATIAVLWKQLANFLKQEQIRYLFGCVSISLKSGQEKAQEIVTQLNNKGALDDSLDITPINPAPFINKALDQEADQINASKRQKLPPLLRSYVNMGARVSPLASLDKEFNVADLFILLDTHSMHSRYSRHFLK